MRRTALPAIALLTLLAACKVEAPVVPGPKKSQAPAARSAEPSAAPASAAPATARPGASPSGLATSARPSVGLAGVATLARPAGAIKLVTGAVRVDASYLVAAGAGNILSHNGGQIVAAGAGNIIGPNGGQIISQNGGQIVAAGAGNVIVNNSGNILSQNGGQIISPNGGQLVAAGAGNYALLQAPAASASAGTPPPAGTQLPAAGMELRARSLRSGGYLPIGVDPDGKPVYAIYTNAQGGYEIFLPDDEVGNVLLEARVPARTDERLALDVLADTRQAASPAPASASPAAASASPDAAAAEGDFGGEVNEVNATVTRYIRTCLVGRFVEVCQREDIEAVVADWGADATAVAVVGEFVKIYRGLAKQTGLDKATEADAEAVARRCLDVALAKADLPTVNVPNGLVPGWDPVSPEPPAVAEIVDVVAHTRNQVAARMQADPGYLATWPFASARMPGFEPLKASDPADFVVGAYLVKSEDSNIDATYAVLRWCGALGPKAGQANDQGERLNAGVVAVTMYICGISAYDEEVKAGCAQAFQDWKAGRLPVRGAGSP